MNEVFSNFSITDVLVVSAIGTLGITVLAFIWGFARAALSDLRSFLRNRRDV